MRVAVVGGGFSGLLAAYLLEQKGVEVTLFERNDALGGHCSTLVGRGFSIELGTVFCLNDSIRELFDELEVGYVARYSHRNFVDSNYARVELLPRRDVPVFLAEKERLNALLRPLLRKESAYTYGYIPPELNVPLSEFLARADIRTWGEVVKPHLSAFGFGSIEETQAYYAFHVFDEKTVAAFVRAEQLLFLREGMQHLIRKLSEHTSDIRYTEVMGIKPRGGHISVETRYGAYSYDKVIVATHLERGVMAEEWAENFLRLVETNPYVTCAFEVESKNIATTYYLANLGKRNRLQFFHPYKSLGRTIVVAYAYGALCPELVNSISADLTLAGIKVKHSVAARQWHIFPHVKAHNLTPRLYLDLLERHASAGVSFIGSLVTRPSMAHLYQSTKTLVGAICN